MTYTDEQRLAYDPFFGDEAELACRTVRMVTTRKEQHCFGNGETTQHTIPPGTRARYEKAFVDRSFWGRYYTCADCMDRFLDEINGTEEDDE